MHNNPEDLLINSVGQEFQEQALPAHSEVDTRISDALSVASPTNKVLRKRPLITYNARSSPGK